MGQTRTVTIVIGNTDDKLTQPQWSAYQRSVDEVLTQFQVDQQFTGHSHGNEPWQNAAWVFVVEDDETYDLLKGQLVNIKNCFRQDSIAFIEGQTEFI